MRTSPAAFQIGKPMKSSLFLSLALLSAAAVFAPAAQAQSAYCAKPFQHYGSVVLNQGYGGADDQKDCCHGRGQC